MPDVFDLPLRTDEERATHDSFVGSAHEFLRAPSPIRFDHLVRRIAEEREIQFLFGSETLQQLHRVGARAKNDYAVLVKFRFCVTKLGRLDRSTRRIGFGKEKYKHAFPFEIAQRQFFPLIGTQREVGSFVTNFQHNHPPLLEIVIYQLQITCFYDEGIFRPNQPVNSSWTTKDSPAVKRADISNAIVSSGIFS